MANEVLYLESLEYMKIASQVAHLGQLTGHEGLTYNEHMFVNKFWRICDETLFSGVRE